MTKVVGIHRLSFMNKKDVIILIGNTMTGKSTISKELIEYLNNNGIITKKIIPFKVGQKREEDDTNQEYSFITKKEMVYLLYKRKLASHSIFTIENGKEYHYGTLLSSFEESNLEDCNVLISNPKEVLELKELLNDYNVNIYIIQLNVSIDELKRRIRNGAHRGEDDALKRFLRNKDLYEKFSMHDFVHNVYIDNKPSKNIVKEILNIIKGDRNSHS